MTNLRAKVQLLTAELAADLEHLQADSRMSNADYLTNRIMPILGEAPAPAVETWTPPPLGLLTVANIGEGFHFSL